MLIYNIVKAELCISIICLIVKGKKMKLIFNKEQLINAINIVSKAISGKTTNPLMECILFDASFDKVLLSASDLEIGIETKVEANIVEDGKIALEAKLVYDIVRKLDAQDYDITIEADAAYNTIISSNNAVFKIQGFDPEEFNYLPNIEKDKHIKLNQFTLKEVIRQTIFSVSLTDSNKMMSGVLFDINEDIARFVALDGHRISIRNVKLKESYEQIKVVVPSKTLSELARIISSNNDKEINIYFADNYILFEFDDTIVLSRLMEGEYFKIEHMLSSDYKTKINVNRLKLLNAIDSSMILIRENDHKPIILDMRDSSMELRMKSSYGSMKNAIDCNKSGDDLVIAFNPKFFIDALKVIDDEKVDMFFSNPKAPCYIRDTENSYIYIILPVNFIE